MMTSSLFKKIVRTDVLALSLCVLVFHVVCISSVSSESEVSIDCIQLLLRKGDLKQIGEEELPEKGDLKQIDRERIKGIQEILKRLGYYTIEIDGHAGPDTESASEDYCDYAMAKEGVGVVYALTEKDLQEQKAHEDILQKLQHLKGVKFESSYKLRQAVKETIKEVTEDPHSEYESLFTNQDKEQQDERLETYTLTDEYFQELTKKIVPFEILTKLNILQDVAYPNQELFRQALTGTGIILLTKEEMQFIPLIVKKARKEHAFSAYEGKEIRWTGESCGCVLEDLSGVVYGFYPFWLAGEEQTLDFSVLSRIGYYALSFDENGDLNETLPWGKKSSKKGAEFLNIARKYRTKVDIVVYQNDWTNWSQNTKDKLIRNIFNLLTVELTDSFSRIKPYISFGSSSIPTIADGVTLYFDGYPENDQSKSLFVAFIQELRIKLRELGQHYYLNIMLQRDAIGHGVYDFNTIKQLIPECGRDERAYQAQNYVDYFLVFIEEPTKKAKKKLREDVELLFTGIQRRNMLRKILPIITPLIKRKGTDEEKRIKELKQLEDDLTYFEDNFGGVGFWVLPTNKGGGVDFITCTKAIFISDKTEAKKDPTRADDVNTYITKFYQKEGAKPPSGYHSFVTLHRWGFRILFDLLLAIIAVYALLSGFICWLRDLFMKFFWWFISVFFLFIGAFFSLLYCDPSWKDIKQGNFILFIFILVMVVLAVLGYFKRVKRGQLP